MLILTLLIVFVGCKTLKTIQEIPVRTVTTVTEKLIPVKVPADSTLLIALLECDSTNNVTLKELKEEKTKGVKSDLSFNNGKLNYQAHTKGKDTVFVDKTETVEKEVPVYRDVVKIEYRQTGFQNFLSWVGGLALVYILFRIIVKVIKKKLNIN